MYVYGNDYGSGSRRETKNFELNPETEVLGPVPGAGTGTYYLIENWR